MCDVNTILTVAATAFLLEMIDIFLWFLVPINDFCVFVFWDYMQFFRLASEFLVYFQMLFVLTYISENALR